MADDLKRVGIVFKADGSADFTKSLKDVNAVVNENRSAFKLAKSEWNDSTSAMQKLRDTQEYLTQQTEAYSAKVKRLSEILKSQESAENRNEAAIAKTKEQLNNAKASLNNYQSGLEDVEKQLKSGAAQLEEYAKKLDNIGDKATNTGKTLTKGLTAPIVATGTAAGLAWKEIDAAYDNIAAGTGATGDALQELQDSFDNVYANFPAESADVSSSIADINTRFGFTGATLEDCSQKFLKFAEVNNTEVSTAIQDVSRYMGDASIDSSQYASVLDALTAASQASGLEVTKLTEDLTKYGAPLRALGMETQESIALFAQWEKAGVNTEIAFSGMKKAISNWAAAGKDASAEFKATLEQIAAAPDIASATTMAIETFGTKAGPDLADAIQGGRFSVEEFLATVSGSGGQLDATFAAMQDGPDQAKVALNNLKLAGADLADTALTTFAPTITECVNMVKEFTQWFKNLDSGQKNTIITIGLLVAGLGPLIMLFGKTASGISSMIKLGKELSPVISLVKTGMAGLNTTFLASPITWIIGTIVALIATFVLLYNKCEWFRNGVNEIRDSIVNGIKEGADKVVGFFNGVVSFIADNWQGLLLLLVNPFAGAFKLLYDNCGSFREYIDGFISKIKAAWASLTQPFKDVVSGIKNIWENFKSFFKVPKIDIVGGFSLAPLSVPHFELKWFADGGILNSPTIFGMQGGRFLGGGEAGAEAVLPISNLLDYMNTSNAQSNSELLSVLVQALPAAFIAALEQAEFNPEINLYLGNKKLAKEMVDMIIKLFGAKAADKRITKGAPA